MQRPGFLVLGVLIAAALAGCAPFVPQGVVGARMAVEAARTAGAPERSPKEFNAAVQALRESESFFAKGDGADLDFAQEFGEVAITEALSAVAAASAKQSADLEKAQAEARTSKQEAERARAEMERLQPQVRTAEEAARAAEARAERAEAQMAELKRQVAPSSQPATPSVSYIRYAVKKGDTLPKIAARPEIYGDAGQWKRIYDANEEIIGRDRKLNIGQILMIPKP